jgi:hypothetical protein
LSLTLTLSRYRERELEERELERYEGVRKKPFVAELEC